MANPELKNRFDVAIRAFRDREDVVVPDD